MLSFSHSVLSTRYSLLTSGQAPSARDRQGDEGERDVSPWAPNVQLQIFTDLLPAAGDSLPEENQARPGGSLREPRGAWFDRLTTPRKIEGKEVPEALTHI